MSNYTWEYIRKHPQKVKRLLGIDFDQLEQLIEQGKFLHQKKQEEKEKRKIRIVNKHHSFGANLPLVTSNP